MGKAKRGESELRGDGVVGGTSRWLVVGVWWIVRRGDEGGVVGKGVVGGWQDDV